MSNQFQSIESGQGLLKDNYEQGSASKTLSDALKKKRKKYIKDPEKIIDEDNTSGD